MKIVFLDYTQSLGGSNRAAIQMARNLMDAGNEVLLLDFYGNCRPYIEECRNSGVTFKIIHEGNPLYIKAEKNKLRRAINILRMIPNLYENAKKLSRILAEENVDYVCVSTIRPLLCLALASKKARIVFFAHGWYIKSQISRLLSYLLIKFTDKIVAISEATRQALFNNGIAGLNNIYVVHNYIVEPLLPAYKKENDCFTINLCGGFIPGKGHHLAVQVAKVLRENGLKFKMTLTGIIYEYESSKSYYDEIVSMIHKEELGNYIEIILNKTNVLEYTNQCDVLIHPSSSEGLPLAILEAMILKKPVIANPVGGILDLIKDNYNGFITRYDNVNDYVDKIILLASDRELYDKMSRRSYELANECFSVEAQRKELTKVFNE